MKFTIITSTFNAASQLPATRNSIAAQSHRDFEWIIVDGASGDNTVGLARSYGDLVSVLITEKDTGIYNAWNKALPHITGDWVLFLGAGDTLFDADVLSKANEVVSGIAEGLTTVYGSVLVVDAADSDVGRVRDETWQGLGSTWGFESPKVPSHQGVFQRASLFQNGFRFEERMKICADTELMLRELIGGRGERLDFFVAKFLLGGISQLKENKLRKAYEFSWVFMKLGVLHKRPIYQLALLVGSLGIHLAKRAGFKSANPR